jgi:HEPN domain-containing protein
MSPDAARLEDTRAWLSKAQTDVRCARVSRGADPPILEDALFHCQQACEKALKALLAWHDVPFRKTHSLEEVGEQCLRIDPSLRAFVDAAVPLTEFAWAYRYPGEPEEPEAGSVDQAIDTTVALVEAIMDRLPAELRT